MANTLEKLGGLYGDNQRGPKATESWIKHRYHKKGDLVAQIREQNRGREDELSAVRSEELLTREQMLATAMAEITTQVEAFLRDNFEEESIAAKLEHFQTSWTKYFEEYGEDLVMGMAELTDDMEETPIVNYEGYLDKDLVKEQMKSLKKRRAKRLVASKDL